MDPFARRQMWDVIAAVSEQRSVVLTTHSMEVGRHHSPVYETNVLQKININLISEECKERLSNLFTSNNKEIFHNAYVEHSNNIDKIRQNTLSLIFESLDGIFIPLFLHSFPCFNINSGV